MIVRNGILTTLRARKRTFLFTLLIFLLTAALTLGLGLWAYSSKMLDNCDDVYTSVAVVEYIGQDYNNEDAADEYARTAMTAVDDAAICAIQGVKHWEKQRGTLAVVDGYRRSLGDIPFENYAVFTASRFIPFTDWMWADVEADEIPSQYVAYDTVENTYTFYNEGNAAGTYPGYYYDAASRQYYQALMVNGVLQSVSVSNESLPDAYFIVNQDFKTAKAVGITDQTETLDICCYNPDTDTMSMQKETIVQYMVSMDNVLYSHENKDGVLVLVDVRGTDFVPEDGEKYVLHGTLSSEQGNRVFQFADFYEGCETLPWQRISGDDDPALESGIFKEYADKYRIANNYVRVEASDAIECLEVFHQGILYLDQGRFPKAGEENVCVISGTMAVQLGAAPGDTIELQELVSKAGDRYHIEEVQEKQTLTIVGITNANNDYDGRVWVSGAEEGVSSPLFGYQLGRAVLQNADALEAAEQMQSLMPDQTQVTLYDQGYSKAAEPLKNLRSTAMVVTVACICAAVVVLFLFAYLLVGRQRETIELLSALGTPGFKIWQWILSGCILIAGVSSVLGAFAGNLIVGRMVDRVMEFTQNLYSVDDRYSESIAGVTKALPPSIDIGGWPGPLAGAAVFLTALLLCGVFLRLTGKSGRHRRGETKLRLPKAGTSTAGQGAARFALISARRGGWRSKVVVMASLMLAIFLGLLLTGWRDRGRQLDELYENSQIEGMIANTNRRSYNNLSIKAGYMADLWSTGLLDELGVSLGWNYWPKGTKPNFMNADREKVWIASQPEIIALNQITAAPEFYYIEEPEIEWLEGWDEGFLEKADQLPVWKGVSVRGTTAQELEAYPALVSRNYLEAHQLSIGQETAVTVNLKVCNQSVETTVTLKIVGAFSSQGSKDNIYVPLSFWFLPGWITGEEQVITWVDNPIRKLWWNDEDMEACVLTTTNFRTGRFVLRSAYDLDAMRDCLEELNFSAVGILRKNRTTVILLDQSFVEIAEGIRRQMTFMEFLFPVMLLLVAVIGFVISWLMTNGRRMEFAMMRGLGAGRARVFFSFFLEQAGLCLTGCLAAGVVLVAAGGGAAGCLASLIFLACYLAGSALSILAVSKVGLMELLSERE